MLAVLIVGAGGGLGKALVREALSRGAHVSVLVRSSAKYTSENADVTGRITVHEGSGSDPAAVALAATSSSVGVVLGCMGGDAGFARGIAEGAARAGIKKLVGVSVPAAR